MCGVAVWNCKRKLKILGGDKGVDGWVQADRILQKCCQQHQQLVTSELLVRERSRQLDNDGSELSTVKWVSDILTILLASG